MSERCVGLRIVEQHEDPDVGPGTRNFVVAPRPVAHLQAPRDRRQGIAIVRRQRGGAASGRASVIITGRSS